MAISTKDVLAAINAVGYESARRGAMFPQTSDEQREDRQAVQRVLGMIEWYEGNTGCARIKGWPVTVPPSPAAPLVALSDEQIDCIGYTAESGDLEAACDLIGAIAAANTNGGALAAIAKFRKACRIAGARAALSHPVGAGGAEPKPASVDQASAPATGAPA